MVAFQAGWELASIEAELQQAGGTVFGVLPENAVLAHLTPAAVRVAEKLAGEKQARPNVHAFSSLRLTGVPSLRL